MHLKIVVRWLEMSLRHKKLDAAICCGASPPDTGMLRKLRSVAEALIPPDAMKPETRIVPPGHRASDGAIGERGLNLPPAHESRRAAVSIDVRPVLSTSHQQAPECEVSPGARLKKLRNLAQNAFADPPVIRIEGGNILIQKAQCLCHSPGSIEANTIRSFVGIPNS